MDTRGNCWEWPGYLIHGYGQVRYQGQKWYAHRLMWTRWFGPIPDGLNVLHHCDNPPCVNPWHLFLGTDADNNHDRDAKGRQVAPRGNQNGSRLHPEKLARGDAWYRAHAGKMAVGDRNGSRKHPERVARGEAQGSAKLTESDVVEMRRLYAAGGTSTPMLARMFCVRQSTAWLVVAGGSWRHVGN